MTAKPGVTGFPRLRPLRPRRGSAGRDRRLAGAFPALRGLLPLALLLAIWQLIGSERSPYFPPPSTWAQALVRLWTSAELVPAAGATLVTFVIALGAATVLGTFLGLAVGASRLADQALGPTLEFARAMPPAAMVPIAALLLGYEQTMKVTVVTLAAVWPVLLNTRAGVRKLDPVLLDTAKSLQLRRFNRTRKVTFPALLPSIFLGVRLATPISLVIALLVEIVTQVDGIGALIAISQRNYLAGQVYGLILVAGLFSLLVNGLVSALEAYAFRHRPA